jgi:diaminopimelate decarboxylase
MLSQTQLVELANRFGTPLYVYDADKISEQYQKLTTGFSSVDAKFFFDTFTGDNGHSKGAYENASPQYVAAT